VAWKTDINGCGDPLRWPCDTPLPATVGTSPTSGCHSVGSFIWSPKPRRLFCLDLFPSSGDRRDSLTAVIEVSSFWRIQQNKCFQALNWRYTIDMFTTPVILRI
jgi:hypothetical protein